MRLPCCAAAGIEPGFPVMRTIHPPGGGSASIGCSFSNSNFLLKVIRSLLLALLPLPLCAQTAPTISTIPDRSTVESTTSSATFFSVGDAETPAENLIISAESSDTALVPNGNITFGGSATSRSVTIAPSTAVRGSTTITLTVTDGDLMTASSAFLFTVNPRYILPAETIPVIVMTEDTSLTIHYKMGNGNWTPTVTRTNTKLFRTVGTGSTSDLRLQDSGTDRRLRLRPAPGIYGESDVTITITGGPGAPTQTTFKVTVVPRAISDNLLGVPGTTSTFDVLQNDTRPQVDTSVAFQSFTQPAHGTLVEGSVPGTLRYTPAGGFTGNDTFTYTSIYNTGDTATATAYLTVQPYLPIDAKHVDLRMNYVDGLWSNEVHAELIFGSPEAGGSSNPTILDFDEALLMVNPGSIITLSETLDAAAYRFIGKPLGVPIWNLPQASKSGVLWPGVNSESIASGTFASYTPTNDPRATANAAWVRVELVDFRVPEGAHFSMWQNTPSGPKVFWDTIDGVNGPDETACGDNVSDTYWTTVGTHAHMNWSFTEAGHYEIDCRSKAFIDVDGTLVEVTSPVNTIHFMVYGEGDPSTLDALPQTPPTLADDVATTDQNSGPVNVGVLANDSSSPDKLEVLAITGVTDGNFGVASIAPDGWSVYYTPKLDFSGIDTFSYTVTDEHGGVATATVVVTVDGENDSPVFAGYAAATSFETAATISLAEILSKASDPEGDAMSMTAAGPASAEGGAVVLSANSILYTPPAGFSGIDSFPIRIEDAHGATVTGTVTVDVVSNGGQEPNPPQLTVLPGGDVGITFQGIPGRDYQIQRSTDLTTWSTIATVSTTVDGVAGFTDGDPPQPNGFYRLRMP